jgi:hypothetical protein
LTLIGSGELILRENPDWGRFSPSPIVVVIGGLLRMKFARSVESSLKR